MSVICRSNGKHDKNGKPDATSGPSLLLLSSLIMNPIQKLTSIVIWLQSAVFQHTTGRTALLMYKLRRAAPLLGVASKVCLSISQHNYNMLAIIFDTSIANSRGAALQFILWVVPQMCCEIKCSAVTLSGPQTQGSVGRTDINRWRALVAELYCNYPSVSSQSWSGCAHPYPIAPV